MTKFTSTGVCHALLCALFCAHSAAVADISSLTTVAASPSVDPADMTTTISIFTCTSEEEACTSSSTSSAPTTLITATTTDIIKHTIDVTVEKTIAVTTVTTLSLSPLGPSAPPASSSSSSSSKTATVMALPTGPPVNCMLICDMVGHLELRGAGWNMTRLGYKGNNMKHDMWKKCGDIFNKHIWKYKAFTRQMDGFWEFSVDATFASVEWPCVMEQVQRYSQNWSPTVCSNEHCPGTG